MDITTMTRQTGGTKRSSWLTSRRRLLLVRLLLRGPASSAALIGAVQAELGDEGYPPAAPSAPKPDFDAPRRHRVAPYGLFFRPEGHAYLDATLLEVTPHDQETIYASIDYRLDRIVPDTIHILPTMLPHDSPRTGRAVRCRRYAMNALR